MSLDISTETDPVSHQSPADSQLPTFKQGEPYADAIVMSHDYREGDYLQPFTVTVGPRENSKNWRPLEMPLGEFMSKLAAHKEGKKDGPGYVMAQMLPGQRLNNSVVAVTGFGLDLDSGDDPEKVYQALSDLGCHAITYTTHGHGKTSTDVNRDRVVKYAGDRDIDTALMREFAQDVLKWHPAVAETVAFAGIHHDTPQGVVVRLTHRPFPKLRVVIPMVEPYVIADAAPTQKQALDNWKLYVKAMAAKLGVTVDPAATDCARLLYFPRHDAKRAYAVRIWGGPLFDYRTLSIEPDALEKYAAEQDKGKAKSKTPAGRALARWSIGHAAGFQIQDVIEEYAQARKRGGATNGICIECPNDAAHTDAGDTSDTGCFVVNGQMGVSPVFTISCRHGSCLGEGYTNLDFLGMMLAAGWFPREVLEDPIFNPEVLDENGKPVAASLAAEKIAKEDKARGSYLDAIAALTEESSEDEFNSVIDMIVNANISSKPVAYEKALKALKKATGMAVGALRKAIAAKTYARDKAATEESGTGVPAKDGYGGALAFKKRKGAVPHGVSYDQETGEIHATFRNALLLIGFEKWDLGYNELTQNYGLRGDVEYPWPENLGYALTDAIKREIRLWLIRRWGVTFSKEDIEEATMTLARRNTFNPVSDYLAEVEPKWDGVSRVDRWLETYIGVKVVDKCSHPDGWNEPCRDCEHRAYVRSIGKIVLVAAARRARDPGCKFDEMLILEGPQGCEKSTAVRTMGGEYFSDANLGDLTKKEAAMKLRGVWIQENAELATIKKADVDVLKEFLAYVSDRYKIPYAKTEEDFPRRCIFIGTVNPNGGAYLVDLTGNRRFWPVKCGTIDLEALANDRDQLWAEAAMMESRGDSIRLHPSLYGAARAEQAARLADDPWVSILAEYLEGQTGRVTTKELLSDKDALNLPPERQTQGAMKKLRDTMAQIPGWTYKASLRVDGARTAGYEYSPPAIAKPEPAPDTE